MCKILELALSRDPGGMFRDFIAAIVLAFLAAYIAVWGRKRDDD